MFYLVKIEYENIFFYFVVDFIKRIVIVFYYNFGVSEFEWYNIYVSEFRNWLSYNRYDVDVV